MSREHGKQLLWNGDEKTENVDQAMVVYKCENAPARPLQLIFCVRLALGSLRRSIYTVERPERSFQILEPKGTVDNVLPSTPAPCVFSRSSG